MFRPRRRAHLEVDVDERRRLAYLPVDARGGDAGRDARDVDDEVAYGAEEVLCRGNQKGPQKRRHTTPTFWLFHQLMPEPSGFDTPWRYGSASV